MEAIKRVYCGVLLLSTGLKILNIGGGCGIRLLPPPPFVISFVTEKGLLIKEEQQKYMDMVPSNLRYNFCPTAGSSLGYKHTPEARAAIRAANSEALKGNTNRALSVYIYDPIQKMFYPRLSPDPNPGVGVPEGGERRGK
jgi:hypothetical protein